MRVNAQYFRTRLAANLDFKAEECWGEVTFLPLGVRESKKERKSSRRNSPLSSQSILTAHQRWQLSNQVTNKANYLRIFPVRCQHRGLKISDSTLYVDARSINQEKKRHVNPLTPTSDQDIISPCNINTVSNRQVMRINKHIS